MVLRALDPKENPKAWGQVKTFDPAAKPFGDGLGRIIVRRDAGEEKGLPKVKNLTLTRQNRTTQGGLFFWRWRVTWGIGGATSEMLVDATPLQQFALSADMLQVELVATNIGRAAGAGFPYAAPTQPVTAGVFYGEGLTATDQATFTEFVTAPIGATVLDVPPGATELLLGGPSGAWGSATMAYNFLAPGGIQVDAWTGLEMNTFRTSPKLLAVADRLQIINTGAAPVNFSIIWGLDF